MHLAIHQPNFLPRLKVLQKLASADSWVILDSVQFARSDWQNRARILPVSDASPSFWLTLPVSLKGGRSTRIQHVKVQNAGYNIDRCKRSIWHAFRSSRYWDTVAAYWHEVEREISTDDLSHIAVATTVVALRSFARLPSLHWASDLNVAGQNSGLMAGICRRLSASEYLADSGSVAYLKPHEFTGTTIVWQDWQEPTQQAPMPWRNLAFLSFLARYGADELAKHLAAGHFNRN